MALERSVDLAPGDWFWATWRELMPLRKPAAPSFDRAGCCARLEKVPGASYEPGWSWARARIAPTLSEEEACFWLEAMLSSNASAHPDDAATRLATTPPAPTPTPAALVKQLTGERILLPNEFWLPLYNLFPMRDAVGLLLDCDDRLRRATKVDPWTLLTFGVTTTNLGIGFRSLVRPYLTAEEVADLRDAIRARVRLSDWPSQPEAPPPLAFMLAATLGLHGELEPLVESWPDRENASADPLHHLAPEIVFGLGSADAVQHHVRRLRMRLQKPEHARAWLAHTETSALDWLRDSILAQKRKTQAAPLARVLALVRAPEAAAPMVDLLLKSAAPEVGRQWLERYPGQSIPGLVPVAMGRGKAAEAARDLLQSFRRAGHGALIDQTITETAGAGERL
ncbi:MAG: hypothetical protein K0Q72_2544, partial [Armatimonadetes bacterium]|nr:hypothetical protein [Armatimonadota bacterium]